MFLRIKVYFIFSVVMLLIVSVYSGCKKSDSNPTSPVASSSPLVGKWTLSGVTVTNTDGSKTTYTPQQLGLSITWQFNNDNTASSTTVDSAGTTTESGTYSYSNGVLTLTNTSGQKVTLNITLNGNKFTTQQTLTDNSGNPINALLEFTKQ